MLFTLRCCAISDYFMTNGYRRQSGLVLNCENYDYQNLANKVSTRSRNCGQHQLTEHNVTTASSRGYYSNGQDTVYVFVN
jgi:hypothetical protein